MNARTNYEHRMKRFLARLLSYIAALIYVGPIVGTGVQVSSATESPLERGVASAVPAGEGAMNKHAPLQLKLTIESDSPPVRAAFAKVTILKSTGEFVTVRNANDQGELIVEGVGPGPLVIKVEKESFLTFRAKFDIGPENRTLKISLKPDASS